ncbi:MAG: ATP synthase subunit I [Gammaproteobacteria bacterium]|nr:ATP synthase subunit I [Gammaproteobacteria bacterium]
MRFVNTMLKTKTTQIKRIVLIQLAVSVTAGFLSWLVDKSLAASILAGALIASSTNAYFAWKVFSKQKEVESSEILTTYYGAEVGKIILTVMLFVTVFNVIKPLNVVALMCSYLLITIIPVLASFYFNDDDTNRREKNVE